MFSNFLYKINIVSSQSCRCGAELEDSKHFFFDCPRYVQYRHTLFDCLIWLPDDLEVDLKLLTCGDDTLNNEQNEEIFKNVYRYVKNTKRFLVP